MADVRVIATALRFPEGPVAMADGSVILGEIAGSAVTRIVSDGSKRAIGTPGGGPNGVARGPDGAGRTLVRRATGADRWVPSGADSADSACRAADSARAVGAPYEGEARRTCRQDSKHYRRSSHFGSSFVHL